MSIANTDGWDTAAALNYTATYDSVGVCLPHMLEHGKWSHMVVYFVK